jgi:hypothetical protein
VLSANEDFQPVKQASIDLLHTVMTAIPGFEPAPSRIVGSGVHHLAMTVL